MSSFSDYIKAKKQIRQNLNVYKRKRGDIKKRIERDFVDHGIATIPCKVSGIEDIISSYSVEGYESLNSEFIEYIKEIADIIPEKYPIVLSIVGGKFTKKEQEIIKGTIEGEAAYGLGLAEKNNKHLFKMGFGMAIGAVVFGIAVVSLKWLPELPMEFLNIVFWVFAWTLVEYVVFEAVEHRRQRRKAARLACITVDFSEEYDDSDYSENEAQKIFQDLNDKV